MNAWLRGALGLVLGVLVAMPLTTLDSMISSSSHTSVPGTSEKLDSTCSRTL